MFLLARLGVAAVTGFIWKWTRKSAWWVKNAPWVAILTGLTLVATLISLLLEIVIKIQKINSGPGGGS